MPTRPQNIIIGITGGSGAGKTTLAEKVAANLRLDDVLIISQDTYYKDRSNLSLEEQKQKGRSL